ncbi:MAG TPA: histidine kinase [Gammaproteobacteria bacterium]|nr:histidine kinase [Gammaproteobacteria bacterium]
MNGGDTHWRIPHGFGLPRLRAAFAGLGHATALLAFVIAATALKLTANDFPLQTSAADIAAFAREGVALATALLVPMPLLVAACNLAPASGWRRYCWLSLTTSIGVLACVFSPLPSLVAGVAIDRLVPFQLAVFVVLLAIVLEFRHRALATAGALLRVEIDGINADARLRDASLRVLQAQIAPHFLFNTLANVRRLARLDRGAAAAMIGDLVEYFSVTLAHSDAPQATLGDEARLVDAYLRIHRVRMGARLAYEIDVPTSLASVQIPSMMLLTLVENAIKHGLNPLAEGGFVRLRAERRGGELHLEVADNGRGLTVAEGHGAGLANVRARLAILYGARAGLDVGPGQPRGFVANVSIPLLDGARP